MKIKWHITLVFLLSAFSLGIYSYSVKASNLENPDINKIKHNPCKTWSYNPGTIHNFPIWTCTSYKGVNSSINILIREWVIDPEYPFVGEHFYLGIGQYSGSRHISFPSETIKWEKKLKINNFKVHLRAVPVETAISGFNGYFAHDSSIKFWKIIAEPAWEFDKTQLTSGSEISSKYYKRMYYPSKFIDTVVLSLIARNSSYHAQNPTEFKNEPAYRLEVISSYRIDAQATWDSYQTWVEEFKDVCTPGPGESGGYNCTLPNGEKGHMETKDLSHWSDPKGQAQGAFHPINNWKTYEIVDTNLVRWPDKKNHDHIPILVFQSMPLLQKP